MEPESEPIRRLDSDAVHLIVNADDYGYFDGVSRGILKAHREGVVSATGILATSEDFESHVEWLGEAPHLDVGVHLNLTCGVPLTQAYRRKLTRIGGEFSSAASLLRGLLGRSIGLREVEIEWRAQIRRCIEAGLRPCFLNSHEHVHVLPPLFKIVLQLASEFRIKSIRLPAAEWLQPWSIAAVGRNLFVSCLGALNRVTEDAPVPRFLGLARSGRLDRRYFETVLPNLIPGKCYELMCHPGIGGSHELKFARALDYHDWDLELSTLCDPSLPDLLARYNVSVIGYRALQCAAVQDRWTS
jgi:predicted glycoside hydrolase/deacetylase ChbG (UPF0249 family)